MAERLGQGGDRLHLGIGGPGEEHRRRGGDEQLLDDRRTVLGRLARPVDGLGHPLAQVTVVVDAGEPQVGIGQAPQLADGVVGCALARGDLVDQGAE